MRQFRRFSPITKFFCTISLSRTSEKNSPIFCYLPALSVHAVLSHFDFIARAFPLPLFYQPFFIVHIRRVSLSFGIERRRRGKATENTTQLEEKTLTRVLMHLEVLITGCPLFPGNSQEFYGAPVVVLGPPSVQSSTFRSSVTHPCSGHPMKQKAIVSSYSFLLYYPRTE